MSGVTSPSGEPHPGEIFFEDKVDGQNWTEQAADVPESIAWVDINNLWFGSKLPELLKNVGFLNLLTMEHGLRVQFRHHQPNNCTNEKSDYIRKNSQNWFGERPKPKHNITVDIKTLRAN